ncbi:MAG: hypothetical protein ACOX2K_07700 [Bacillota bacterium]|jgi:alkyl hydroperoxide reductase subunit AhpC
MFPTVGSASPSWSLEVYQEGGSRQMHSSELSGRWHVLHFYSGDFTPV